MSMTVGNLIEYLQEVGNPNLPVFVSKDGEGNEFRPASDQLELAVWNTEFREFDFEDVESDPNAVIIWPEW